MALCSKCKRTVPDDSAFCPYCGSKTATVKKCPRCKREIKSASRFCAYCGNLAEENLTCPKCKTELKPKTIFCPTCGLKHYTPEDSVLPNGSVLYEAKHFRSQAGKDGALCIFDNKIHFKASVGPNDNIPIHDVLLVTKTMDALQIRTISGTVYRYIAPKEEQEFLEYLAALLRDCVKWDVFANDVITDGEVEPEEEPDVHEVEIEVPRAKENPSKKGNPPIKMPPPIKPEKPKEKEPQIVNTADDKPNNGFKRPTALGTKVPVKKEGEPVKISNVKTADSDLKLPKRQKFKRGGDSDLM